MQLIGSMRSYFGGLLCCAWSPDARYIATGGEDDLLTMFCVAESRVICRGQGHKSWIAQVAFDAYTTQVIGEGELGSDEDLAGISGLL